MIIIFFLLLVGVRVSAFVTTEDKTPMQKSIIGFLQPGKTCCSGSSQIMHQNLEKEHLPSQSLRASQPVHPPPVQNGQKQEEVRWQSR